MERTKKHPFEDLTDEQLDDILAYDVPMTGENLDRMFRRFELERQKRPRKSAGRIAALLVAVAAVALAGFTNADNIQRLFYQLFGGSVQLEETDYSLIGESATANGFRMDVLSAVRDSENLYLIVQLTDLEGDRLAEDLGVIQGSVEGIGKDLGENLASMSGIKIDMLEYDAAKKTAFLGVHATGSFYGEDAVFELFWFGTGKRSVNRDADEIDLYSLAKDSPSELKPFDRDEYGGVGIGGLIPKGRSPGERVDPDSLYDSVEECLVLDSMSIPVQEYGSERVSGIAYKDGKLHIQFKPVKAEVGNAVVLSLRNIETGERLDPIYYLSLGTRYMVGPDGNAVDTEYHTELVFELDSLDALKDYRLHVEGEYYENSYSGNWGVRFAAPEEVTSVALPIAVSGEPALIKRVTVTPLSVVVLAGEKAEGGFDVTLVYKDGTEKRLAYTEVYNYENGEQEWHYASAFLFGEIAEVKINGMGFAFPEEG